MSQNDRTTDAAAAPEGTWAPPLALIAASHFEALFQGFERATGVKRTKVCKIVMDDGSFHISIHKHSKKLDTYDRFIAGMSAIWPEGYPWPEAIPRQRPADLSPEARAMLDEALNARARPVLPPLPAAMPFVAGIAETVTAHDLEKETP